MRLAALLLPVALLTGCASTQASATPESTPNLQDAYIKVMHAVYPEADNASIITLGKTVCAGLDAGRTPDALAQDMLATGRTNEAGTRVIIRGAVAVYCPKHADIVPPQ